MVASLEPHTVEQASPLRVPLEAEMLLQSEVPPVAEKFAVEVTEREWNAAYAAWCDAINYCSTDDEGFDLEEFMSKKKNALGM